MGSPTRITNTHVSRPSYLGTTYATHAADAGMAYGWRHDGNLARGDRHPHHRPEHRHTSQRRLGRPQPPRHRRLRRCELQWVPRRDDDAVSLEERVEIVEEIEDAVL